MADEPLFIRVVKGLPQAARQVFGGMGGQVVQGVKTLPALGQAVAQAPFAVAQTLGDVPRQFKGFVTNTPAEPSQSRTLPLVGEVIPYGRRFLNYQQEPGYTPALAGLRALSEGALDAAVIGQVARSAGQKVSNHQAKAFAKAQPKSVEVEIQNHITSARQVTQGKTVTPAYIEHLKTNIVDGIKGRYPEVSRAVSKLPIKGSVDDFLSSVEDTVRDTQIRQLVKNPESLQLFRGESAANAGGTHFTTDPTWAKNFGDTSLNLTLPKGAKVYQLQTKDIQSAIANGAKNEADVFKTIFDKGYDAIVGSDAMNAAKVDVIINPSLKNLAKAPFIPNTFDPPAGPAVQSFLKTSLKNFQESGGGLSIKRVGTGPDVPFEGFTDLSTKLLEKLKGRTTVSKQFIDDLTNSGDLKQPEKDLFRKLLADEPDTINVTDFANRVKSELLPLNRTGSDIYKATSKPFYDGSEMIREGDFTPKYENISLPPELRGKVANYSEHIYESPIPTSAGDVHFNYQTKNYFAHSRIEDLPSKTNTRRVIEVQSDLFQKGRLESEFGAPGVLPKGRSSPGRDEAERFANKAKLEPYRNTWHERVIREEVKQAALDGKTKLQFPTGETAMKIEGLGETARWFDATANTRTLPSINERTLKVGQEITQQNSPVSSNSDVWIITDVLGDGKFKAIPKQHYERATEAGGGGLDRLVDADRGIRVRDFSETFDISGKVDTENPIYKFYEKEVGKYLKNKYNAQLVTDAQGVKWWEVTVGKEFKKLPIEAFGIGVAPIFGGQMPQSTPQKSDRILKSPNQNLFINK